MGSSPQVPSVTDPNITAANQQTLNTNAGQSSQQGSMVNQSNPFGSLNYSQTGTSSNGTPLYTATTTLSPAEQQLLTQLQGTQTTAGGQAGKLLSNANYGANPTDVIGNGTAGLTGAAVAQQTAYLKPYFDTQTSQLDTQLRNQGFAPGQPGYDNAMRGLQNNQNNTVTGFISQIEPQMFQQATQEYQMPAQLAESLAGFGSPTTPNQSFVSTPSLNIAPADLTGATASAQQAQMAAYNAQLNQQNNMMSGLFGIPTAILGGWAKSGGLGNLMGAAALA